MCFDIRSKIESQYRRAFLRNKGNDESLKKELEQQIELFRKDDYEHAFAYDHPQLLIYTNTNPEIPIPATWGLVPDWVKTKDQTKSLWNSTVNAKSETMHEKASFRKAARSNKCVLYVDGFFEHHHHGGKTYPYYIQRKDGKPFALACLYSQFGFVEKEETTTFTILTTKANTLMAKIHNNPKLKEPRMPVILKDEDVDEYLGLKVSKRLDNLFLPFPDDELKAHTVGKIRGKNALGNVPEVTAKRIYPELEEFKLF